MILGLCRHLHDFCLLAHLILTDLSADSLDSMHLHAEHIKIGLLILFKRSKQFPYLFAIRFQCSRIGECLLAVSCLQIHRSIRRRNLTVPNRKTCLKKRAEILKLYRFRQKFDKSMDQSLCSRCIRDVRRHQNKRNIAELRDFIRRLDSRLLRHHLI